MSHAPLLEVNVSFYTNLEAVSVIDDHVQDIKHAPVDDPVLQVHCDTIVEDWPDKLPD